MKDDVIDGNIKKNNAHKMEKEYKLKQHEDGSIALISGLIGLFFGLIYGLIGGSIDVLVLVLIGLIDVLVLVLIIYGLINE